MCNNHLQNRSIAKQSKHVATTNNSQPCKKVLIILQTTSHNAKESHDRVI